MRRPLAAALAALVVLTPVPAAAKTVGSWQMNEHRGTTKLHDSSGHGHSGRIGRLVRLNGSSHGFRPIARGVYRAGRIDVVPDYPALDPERHRFAVTVRFNWSHNNDNTFVQKGQSGAAGGLFKMKETATGSRRAGYVFCLFRGSIGDSTVASYTHRRLDDGRWHTVGCRRTARGTAMTVDGRLVDRNSNDPGRISNSWPVSIGGNRYCNSPDLECNYFWGRIGSVRWQVG